MKKRHKSDYHLLVAQNFLSNISRSGSHDDTNLKIFNASRQKTGDGADSLEKSSNPSGNSKKNANHLVMQCQRNLRAQYSEGFYDSMIAAEARCLKKKKPSLFQRFIKIISIDEFFSFRSGSSETNSDTSECSESEHYGSMVSLEAFENIKPFRTNLPRCNRDYLCDVQSEIPLVVTSHFRFRSDDKKRFKRSRSLLFLGDRKRNVSSCSYEEIKPYAFPGGRNDKTEYSFSDLLRRKKTSVPASVFALRQSARRDSTNRASTCRSYSQDFLEAVLYSNIHDNSEILEWNEVPTDSYNPRALEEVDQMRKTIIKCPGFVGVTYHYLPRNEMKNVLNNRFTEKFPNVNLTYSKFRSIKAEMVSIARDCEVDLMTISQGIVFFERIVAKGAISKHNRKMVAGASLLVAMKLHDYTKEAIKKMIQNTVERLRISRKELLALEIPLCVGLQFDLYSPPDHILPHFQRYRFQDVKS